MTSRMFEPLTLRGMTMKNRIAMAPMLMYMAGEDGTLSDRHLAHYGARMLGGVGMVMTEVIAVEPAGRISDNDLGLWNDGQTAGIRRLADLAHDCGTVLGVQLAHAGRKAHLASGEAVAPSPIRFNDDFPVPTELSTDDIARLVQSYGDAATRAAEAGVDCVEIHAAHGYLLHEFLAPLTNQRDDAYGGPVENRARIVLEIVDAIRAVWPEDKPVFARITGSDLRPDGVTEDEAVWLATSLRDRGVDLLAVSSGNLVPSYPGEIVPAYQVHYSAMVRAAANIPTGAVGSITSPELVEHIIDRGEADIVFLGRELLRNPFWPIQAAKAAGVDVEFAVPTYVRATGPWERGF